jgi:hypothetical protein
MDNKTITNISLCRVFKIIRPDGENFLNEVEAPTSNSKKNIQTIDKMLKELNVLLKEINI